IEKNSKISFQKSGQNKYCLLGTFPIILESSGNQMISLNFYNQRKGAEKFMTPNLVLPTNPRYQPHSMQDIFGMII
ncbi:hypothetical protein ACFL14_03075, partial [Patescibacteria group bacterium]